MRSEMSVLVTTYNNENFIEECLNSVLSQNVNEPFQIILFDSASTDSTVEIARNILGSRTSNFQIVVDRENRFWQGSAYMLSAISSCQGEFIAFLDGDDFWIDNSKLEKQLRFLRSNPGVSVVGTSAEVWNQTQQVVERVIPEVGKLGTFPGRDLAAENYLVNSSVMARNHYENIQTNFYSMCLHKDYPLWAYLTQDSSFAVLPDITTRYRTSTGSNITQTYSDSFRKAIDVQTRALLALNQNEDLSHLWLSSIFDDLYHHLTLDLNRPIYSKVLLQITNNDEINKDLTRKILEISKLIQSIFENSPSYHSD